MNKVLNIIAILFGLTLLFCGLIKLFGLFSSITLFWNDTYLNLPNSTNLFFIIMVNFIGGIAMVYHAIKTYKFKEETAAKTLEYKLLDTNTPLMEKEMPRLVMLSGSITLIISLWFFVRLIGVLGETFAGVILKYIELFILVGLLYGSFAIIPIILVAKNISLNSKIMKRKERKKIAAYHAKKKTMQSNRKI